MPARYADSLDAHAQQLLSTSVAWMDDYWDAALGLLRAPGDLADPHHPQPMLHHMVRESAWYALGLFVCNGDGDAARAIHALDAILDYQFDEPGQVYHGTFYRAPEEAHPPDPAIEWRHYDPNWREFIITTLAIILLEYEHQLPPALVSKIDVAIRRAVEGALTRGLSASYTNIALMNAFMLCFAGGRLREPVWIEQGEAMAREIHRLFKLHDTFPEYNSPTYYGPDLYALAEWRVYGGTPLLRQLGAEMEALLWSDVARFYHAGLKNLCGPFDRSYGMDMRHYVAVLGEWVWLVTGHAAAPFPTLDQPFAHAGDLCFAPCAAILGAAVPSEAAPHFFAFQGERQIERIIADSPQRVATAWLSPGLMIGAERTTFGKRGYAQFHPGTIYWRSGADEVGWIRLMNAEPLDARASANRLDITAQDEIWFQISAPGAQIESIHAARWQLPGLDVQIQINVSDAHIEHTTHLIEVRYHAGAGQSISCVLTTRLA